MSGFLPQVAFRWFKPDGTPAFGYTAAFFGAGLTPIQANLKTIYDQTDLAVPISQTTVLPQLGVPFDVEGKVTVVLGDGSYLVAIYNELNVLVFSIDNVSSGSSNSLLFANNITALRAISVNDAQLIGFCTLLGYYNPGDDGHGAFWWSDTEPDPDDNGYTIAPLPTTPITGRWKRLNDENGDVRAAAYGYDANTASNQTAEMIAADAYAFANNRRLRIGLGTSALLGTMSFNSNVIFEGSGITGTGSPTITFDGTVEGPTVKLFYSMTVIMMSLCHDVKPEWWGAMRDGLNDDILPIKAMFASGAGSCFFTAGTYLVVGDPLTPAPLVRIIRADGQVQDGGTTYVYMGFDALAVNSKVRADQIEALSTLVVGTTAVIGSSVTAGGFLQGQVAGTNFKAGGTIQSNNTPVSITANGNLMAAVIPANTMLLDSDSVEMITFGLFTFSGSNVSAFLKYGAVTIDDLFGGSLGATTIFTFRYYLVRTSSTTATIFNPANGTQTDGNGYKNLVGLDFTMPITLQFSALLASATPIKQTNLNMIFRPAGF